MNAKELHDTMAASKAEFPGPAEMRDLILRALRLLAAAEANDGAGCELIENLRTEADLCRNETATDIAVLLDDAASALIATGAQFNALKDERNGLAARVAELEPDAERIKFLGAQNRWNGGTGYSIFQLDSGDVYVRPMKPENAASVGVAAHPDIRAAIDAAMKGE